MSLTMFDKVGKHAILRQRTD